MDKKTSETSGKKITKEQKELLEKLQAEFGIESKHKDEKFEGVFDKIKSWFN